MTIIADKIAESHRWPIKNARAMKTRMCRVVLGIAAVCLPLTACGSQDDHTPRAQGAAVRVVASTNVYSDIVEELGGSHVEVTTLQTNPDQDPHSFEASPKDALAISRADLVIKNGGGYDDYMDTLIGSTETHALILSAVTIFEKNEKKKTNRGSLNEHVWYDLPTVKRLAEAVTTYLMKSDSDKDAEFKQRLSVFSGGIDKLIGKLARIRSQATGTPIAVTEPVPLYMTEAAGLVDKTPRAFSEAIEEGSDVSASVLNKTLSLFAKHEVELLLYNRQTADRITGKVRSAAKKAGVPVVSVTETLPPGTHYLEWMRKNIDAIGTRK